MELDVPRLIFEDLKLITLELPLPIFVDRNAMELELPLLIRDDLNAIDLPKLFPSVLWVLKAILLAGLPRPTFVLLNPIALPVALLRADCTKWSPILEELLLLVFMEKKLPEPERLLDGLLLKKLDRPFLLFPLCRKDMFLCLPTDGLVNPIFGHDMSWAWLPKEPLIINKVDNRYVKTLIIKVKMSFDYNRTEFVLKPKVRHLYIR